MGMGTCRVPGVHVVVSLGCRAAKRQPRQHRATSRPRVTVGWRPVQGFRWVLSRGTGWDSVTGGRSIGGGLILANWPIIHRGPVEAGVEALEKWKGSTDGDEGGLHRASVGGVGDCRSCRGAVEGLT